MIEKTKVEQVMMMIKERPLATPSEGGRWTKKKMSDNQNEVKEVDDVFGSD